MPRVCRALKGQGSVSEVVYEKSRISNETHSVVILSRNESGRRDSDRKGQSRLMVRSRD